MKIFSLLLFFSLVAWSGGRSDADVAGEGPQSRQITLAKSEITSPLPLFDENSITRDYLNSHTGLKWKNKLGDWVDLNGTPQGAVPWASAYVNSGGQDPIILDVTTLASAQRGKKDQLMVLSATIPVDVWSREGVQGPKLKITLMDDNLVELSPHLDCAISTSTFSNINSGALTIDGSSYKAFLQFKIPKKEFKSAILELWPKKIWRSGQVQVFNLDPPDEMFSESEGIAQGLSSYADLKGHPDVIFVDTFDEPKKIKSEWFMQTKLESEQVNNGVLTGEIGHGDATAVNIRYFFAKQIKEEPTESYFRYSVRFHKDFINATQDGKLPGQAGTYNRCGWGGRKPSKTCEAWSARMHWKRPIKMGPYRDLIPIGTYLYHMGQEGKYGDNEMWQAFCQMDQWCELEQYVKLNTPGEDDGILRGYHNGELVFERKDIRYRESDNVRIEDVWLTVYHGGMGFPTEPINADIDNVVIATKYIGKVGQAKISEDSQPTWHQNPLLTKLPENSAIDLGKFSCTVPQGDGNSCVKVTDYSGMVYDRNHHQILMFGGGHAATFTDTVFIFNFDSLKWKEDYPPTPCTTQVMNEANYDLSRSAWKKGPAGPYPRPISTHTYDQLAVATDLPEFIVLKGGTGESIYCPPEPPSGYYYSRQGKVAHYQLKTRTWTFSDTTSGDEAGKYAAAEYDPVSGMIVVLGRYGLFVYDPVRKTKIRLKNTFSVEDLGLANELVYYSPNDRMYYFEKKSKTVWELKLDRNDLMKSTLRKLSVTGKYPTHGEPGYAFDSVNRIIGGAVHNNRFYIFDPRMRTWSSQLISGGKPGNMAFHCMIYDPVDNVFVFLTEGRKTWAYRYQS